MSTKEMKVFAIMASLGVFLMISLNSIQARAQVSGNIFKDFNTNGQRDLPNEIGFGNVKITAFLESGVQHIANSNFNGDYSFTISQIPAGVKVRLEFGNLRGNFASLAGSSSKSTVLFTEGGDTEASLGILGSNDYCNFNDPLILTSCYVSGDPLGGGSAGDDAALVTFPYTASGLAGVDGPSVNYVAKISEVGSVWGMTYQPSSKKFLVASLVRRHSGLGPLGTGGLYLVDDFSTQVSPFIDVKDLGIDTGNDPRLNSLGQNIALPADKLIPNEDSLTLHTAGKMGIGSITLSQDEKTVYFVNLFDRKLYSFFVGAPMVAPLDNSSVKSFTIPDPSGSGDFRPWAVTEKNGVIYVGVVNSAETSQDFSQLSAHIYSLNVDSGIFTEIFSMPLTYKKGFSDVTDQCINIDTWRAWSDEFPQGCAKFFEAGKQKWVNFAMNPQPILSSIQFDNDGSLIIGFMDRFGLYAGYRNLRPVDDGELYDGFVGGDILRAQYDPFNNNYTLESNGISGSLVGVGAGNGEGPGGGEFFGDDTWSFKGNAAHAEITNGGIMTIPGTGEIIVSAMDPIDEIYQSGGFRVFDRTNGELKRGYALYSDVPGTLGKSGGIGEFKMDCDPTPIELGNRIWNDLNKDGIQDPNEPGIDGVQLTLHDMEDGGALVGSTSTANGGCYSFNLANVPTLLYNRNYEIRMSFAQEVITNGKFISITSKDSDTSENGDERDSDAIRIGDVVSIPVNSGFPGKTTNSYDIGVVGCSIPMLSTDLVDLEYCENAIPIIDLEDAPSDVFWSLKEAYPGVAIEAQNGIVTGLNSVGEYTIYLTNFRESSCRDSLKIIIKNAPNAGIDQQLCAPLSTAQLTGTPANGLWTAVAGNPSNATVGASSGLVGNLTSFGKYQFVYTLGECTDTVTVERFSKPNAGIDQQICEPTSTVQLNGIPANGVWSASSGNPSTSTVTSSTGLVSDLNAIGKYQFVYTIGNCSDTVMVERFSKSNAGIDQQLCAPLSTAQLTGTPANGLWTAVAGNPSNATVGASSGLVGNITKVGKYLFVYSVGSCSDTVLVEQTASPYAGQDSTICSFIKELQLIAQPLGGTWAVDVNNTNSSSISNSGLVSGIAKIGSYNYIYTLNGCSDTVKVNQKNCLLGTIGNFAWYDANKNGIQDKIIDPLDNSEIGDELPVKGVKLKLFMAGVDTPLDSAITGENGFYEFNNLLPGQYFVEFDDDTYPGVNYLISAPNLGSNGAKDSDFDRVTYKTSTIDLALSEIDLTWDLGFFRSPKPTITNPCACNTEVVYLSGPDGSGDYIFNERIDVEATPGGVWRIIAEDPASGKITRGIRLDKDGDGYPEAIANPEGLLLNVNPLDPGNFYFEFSHIEPIGYEIVVSDGVDTLSILNSCTSIQEEYDEALNNTCAFAEEFVLQTDFETGTAQYFFLQDSIFKFDRAINRTELIKNAVPVTSINPRDYPSGSTIALYIKWIPNGDSNKKACEKTVVLNVKLSSGDECLASLGNFTWEDMNGNGVFDNSELPLAGVKVTLLDSFKNPVTLNGKGEIVTEQTTNINGFYEFVDLVPGKYCVQFGDKVGFERTIANAGAEEIDSDANPINGLSELVELTAGEMNKDVDAGYVPLGSIGDFVWYDNNDNGIQDNGENGVFNITLVLYQLDENNVPVQITSTQTDQNGRYLFENVRSGAYIVELGANIPAGFEVGSKINVGGDNELDNDFSPATKRTGITIINNFNLAQRHIRNVDAGIVSDCENNACVVITIRKTR